MMENLGCLRDGDVIISASDIDELLRYRDLKEQGRLIELPCAVGDTVYIVYSPNRLVEPYTFKPIKIESLTKLASYIEKNAFGKTVFLSQGEAEAEAALKGAEQ